MVSATSSNYQTLDVKLSLDLSNQGKNPIVKRVLATDYDKLMAQAQSLAEKYAVSGFSLQYFDGDDWTVVEDNSDL